MTSWRLTVGFFGVVVLLAFVSLLNTDFGGGGGTDDPALLQSSWEAQLGSQAPNNLGEQWSGLR